MKYTYLTLVTALFLGLVQVPSGYADDSTSTAAPTTSTSQNHRHHRGMHKVMKACAAANGITLPAKGSGETLSSGDKNTIHACAKEFFASVKTCMQNAGVSKPTPGQPFSSEDKAAFKECRTQSLSAISKSSS